MSPLPSVSGSSPDIAETSPRVVAFPVSPVRRRSLRSLLGTITGICFIFGALLAVQLRAIQNIQKQRERKTQSDARQKQSDALQKQIAVRYRLDAQKAQHERDDALKKLNDALIALKTGNTLSGAQVKALAGQIRQLQALACLTPITGAGVRIVLSDNPQANQVGANPSLPLPGLVHDYDVLQVVNELRSAKAGAIAVSGADNQLIRITGTTPIRCVGPVIFINWQPVAAPFSIEAIGSPKTLKSALEMPGGIVENMRNQGGVGVKVSGLNELTLPAADSEAGAGASSVSLPPSDVSLGAGVTSLAPKGA